MRKAFTLIELLVAVAIIGILATLVTINLTSARTSSRDARRQTDVKNYTAAVEKYHITNSSYFITDTGGCSSPSATTTGCVGANGASYGRMNLKSVTEAEKPYASTTIAQALLNQGLIDKIAKDPSNNKDDNTPDQPDYVLIRCEKDGSQALGRTDAGFAIWTQLEKKPNLVSAETTTSSCGGSLTNFNPDNDNVNRFGSTKLKAAIFSSSDVASSTELSSNYFAAGSGRMVAKTITTHTAPPPHPVGPLPCSGGSSVFPRTAQPKPEDAILIGGTLCNAGTVTATTGNAYVAKDITNNGIFTTEGLVKTTQHLMGNSVNAAGTHSIESHNQESPYILPIFSEFLQKEGMPDPTSQIPGSNTIKSEVDQETAAAKSRLNQYLANPNKVTISSGSLVSQLKTSSPLTLNNQITIIPGSLYLSNIPGCSLIVKGIIIVQGTVLMNGCSINSDSEMFIQGNLEQYDNANLIKADAVTVINENIGGGELGQVNNAGGLNTIEANAVTIITDKNNATGGWGMIRQKVVGNGINSIKATTIIFTANTSNVGELGQVSSAGGTNSIEGTSIHMMAINNNAWSMIRQNADNSTNIIKSNDLTFVATGSNIAEVAQRSETGGTNSIESSGKMTVLADNIEAWGMIRQYTVGSTNTNTNRITTGSLVFAVRNGSAGSLQQTGIGTNSIDSDTILVATNNKIRSTLIQSDSTNNSLKAAHTLTVVGNIQSSDGAKIEAEKIAVDGYISLTGAQITAHNKLYSTGNLSLNSASGLATSVVASKGLTVLGNVTTQSGTSITADHN